MSSSNTDENPYDDFDWPADRPPRCGELVEGRAWQDYSADAKFVPEPLQAERSED